MKKKFQKKHNSGTEKLFMKDTHEPKMVTPDTETPITKLTRESVVCKDEKKFMHADKPWKPKGRK